MPVVNVEGVGPVTFPDDMSQQEIVNAIENDILKTQAPQQEEVGFGEYLLNRAKLGLTGSAALVGGLAKTLPYAKETFLPEQPVTMGQVQGTEEIPIEKRSTLERTAQNIGQTQKQLAQYTGAQTEMKAPSRAAAIVGSAVESATDPANLLFGPMTIAGKAGSVGVGALGGGLAEVGGQIGEQVTGGQGGRLLGSLLGGGAGAKASLFTRPLVATGADAISQVRKNIQAINTMGADTAETALANSTAKNMLNKIASSYPGGIEQLQQSVDKATKAAGKNVPLFVSMAEDPIIQSELIRLAKTNPQYRKLFEDQVNSLSEVYKNKLTKLFGERGIEIKGLTVPVVSVDNAVKRSNAIQGKIDDLGRRFPEADQATVGKAVENLIEAKKTEVRSILAPEYKAIEDDAILAGAKVPADQTEMIFNFVKENRLRDIFGKGTALDNKVTSVLSPKAVPASSSYDPVMMQRTTTPATTQFPELSMTDVMSLKSEINRLQRTVRDDNSLRKLNQLEDVVDSARKSLGEFDDRLRAVDRKYYEQLGVPFSEAGIKDIDAKKYAEQVGTVLLKNGTSTKHFLSVAGEEGQPILKNAVMADLHTKAIDQNGALNPKALEKYLRDKKDSISQVPGLKEELQATLIDDSILRNAKVKLDKQAEAAQQQLASNYFNGSKLMGEYPNLNALVSSMRTNPGVRGKVLQDIKKLDPDTSKAVMQSLRAEFVNDMLNTTGRIPDFLKTPENKALLQSLFGGTTIGGQKFTSSGYIQSLEDIAELAQKVNTRDFSKLGMEVATKETEALAGFFRKIGMPGMDKQFLFSAARDRISSVPYKIVRILSRVDNVRTAEKTDEALKDLLLNPNAINDLKNLAVNFDISFKKPEYLKHMKDTMYKVVPQYMYTGAKTGMQEAPAVEVPQVDVGY